MNFTPTLKKKKTVKFANSKVTKINTASFTLSINTYDKNFWEDFHKFFSETFSNNPKNNTQLEQIMVKRVTYALFPVITVRKQEATPGDPTARQTVNFAAALYLIHT